ncbi:MAG: fumarylacetoacetate hydrolase family protein [Bacteroidaceae bacterium]|jgi:2-keto-4-pentenoate hydratase/2-oxohepta-3-ene-1,7-dioic acid hydratase (catechol pathway)|nr:fumarylacetoacetate hydrolase family protein [Bacteroidaceae bacterium]MBR4338540.1 fumarylacetoacetate hydrolase family protein [Bacteroidaceae bacterium]
MKILCVGMNYAEHNKELENTLVLPESPVIFMKPDSAILKNGKPLFLPDFAERFDYETELVVRIHRMGKSIPERFAHRYYDAVTIGIDVTARDLQRRLKDKGLPWEMSKAFDGSAILGEFVPVEEVGDVQQLTFHAEIDGRTVQTGWTGDMLFSVDRLIAYVSQFHTLKTGDLLFTGTPAGVGPLHVGEHLDGYLGERKVLSFNIK